MLPPETNLTQKRLEILMANVVTSALHFAELPDVLTPQDLIKYLPIGRDSIYAALKSQAIRNVRLGQTFIVTKAALREFLGGAVE